MGSVEVLGTLKKSEKRDVDRECVNKSIGTGSEKTQMIGKTGSEM